MSNDSPFCEKTLSLLEEKINRLIRLDTESYTAGKLDPTSLQQFSMLKAYMNVIGAILEMRRDERYP